MTQAMTDEIGGAVIVRFNEQGEIEYYVFGDKVRLFIVDENAPNDRVYDWTPRHTEETFKQIIFDMKNIGSSQDDRHKAIEARVKGEGLSLVVDNPEQPQ